MTSNTYRRNGADPGSIQETKRKKPLFVVFLAVACTVLAGLGDWKVLNNAYGGLPKAIALGTIVCAFLNFLVDADFARIRKAMGYFPVFLVLIAVYVFISMYIWVTDFSQTSSISRAGQKIFFQTVRGAFGLRRKTLLNALASAFPLEKDVIREAIERTGLPPEIRGEKLGIPQFSALSDEIKARLHNG